MNFNRRPKRIAGPGFNINVKFDFKQMAESRTNGQAHKLFPIDRSDECYDIKEQELLVTRKENKMVDAHSHVFSSLNGYPGLAVGVDENACRIKILKDVYFIGVALTEYKPDQQGYEQQGSVAQVAGVVTMINESNEIIYPGQTLVMDIQINPFNRRFTSDKGIPREKRRLVVRPLTDVYMTQLGNDPELIRKCIVGKAYSHARPDERFEMGINIGHEYRIGSAVKTNKDAEETLDDALKANESKDDQIEAIKVLYTGLAGELTELKKQNATIELDARDAVQREIERRVRNLNIEINHVKEERDKLYTDNQELYRRLHVSENEQATLVRKDDALLMTLLMLDKIEKIAPEINDFIDKGMDETRRDNIRRDLASMNDEGAQDAEGGDRESAAERAMNDEFGPDLLKPKARKKRTK